MGNYDDRGRREGKERRRVKKIFCQEVLAPHHLRCVPAKNIKKLGLEGSGMRKKVECGIYGNDTGYIRT
jgi:hypothetical protein